MSPIIPMPQLQVQRSVPYALRPFNSRQPYVPKPYFPVDNSYEQNILDYNDSLAINSLADVILNEAALNKQYPSLRDKPGFDWADIQQRIQAAVGLTKEATIDPIVAGFKRGQPLSGFGDALINGLQNLGETADILANPVKGMMFEPKGAKAGLIKGLGIGAEGRTNYDWNKQTGLGGFADFAVNITGEILSDPLNWVTIGAWGLGKAAVGGVRELVEEGVQTAAKKVGLALSDDMAETVTKQTLKLLRKEPDKIAEGVTRVVNSLAQTTPAWKGVPQLLHTGFVNELTEQLVKGSGDNLTIDILQSLRRWANGSDQIQKILNQSVGWSTGVLPSWYTVRFAGTPLFEYIHNKTTQALVPHLAKDGTIPVTKLESALQSWEDVMRYPLKTGAVDGDVVAETAQAMRLASIQADHHAVLQLMGSKLSELPGKLDKYFLEKAQVNFTDYLAFLDEFSKRFPVFERYAAELNGIADYVQQALTHQRNVRLGKTVRRVRAAIKDAATAIKHAATDKAATAIGKVRETGETVRFYSGDLRAALAQLDNALNDADVLPNLPRIAELRDQLALYTDMVLEYEQMAQAYLAVNMPRVQELHEQIQFWKTRAGYLPSTNLGVDAETERIAWEIKDYLDKLPIGSMTEEELDKAAAFLERAAHKNPDLTLLFDEVFPQEGWYGVRDVLEEYNLRVGKLSSELDSLRVGRLKPPQELLDVRVELSKLVRENYELSKAIELDLGNQVKLLEDDMAGLLTQKVYKQALEEMEQAGEATLEKILAKAQNIGADPTGYRTVDPAVAGEALRSLNEELLPLLNKGDLPSGDYYASILDDIQNELSQAVGKDNFNTVKNLNALFTELQQMKDTLEGITEKMVEKRILPTGDMLETDIYEDVLYFVDDILDKLGDMDLKYYPEKLMNYLQDKTVYRLKMAQLNAMQTLLRSDTADAFINRVLMAKDTGATLLQLKSIPEYEELVTTIQSVAYSHQTFRQLLDRIVSDPVLAPLKANILDTIQTYKMRDLDKLWAHKEYYISEVIAKLQEQLSSVSVRTRLKLEELVPIDDAAFRAYAQRTGYTGTLDAHDAQADVLRTMFLYEDPRFLGHIELDPAYTHVFYDVETTGKVVGRDQLLQIAWRTTDGKSGVISVKAQPGVYPDDTLLQKLFDQDVQKARDIYTRTHINNPEALTEHDTLVKFMEGMHQIEEKTGKPIKLMAYNGDAFDNRLMLSRMREIGNEIENRTQRQFRNFATGDTLSDMRIKHGGVQLSAEQRTALARDLRIYLEAKGNNPYSDVYHQKFINTIDGDLATPAKQLDQMLKDTRSSEVVMLRMELATVQADIWDKLRAIRRQNSDLAGYGFIVNPITKELLDVNGEVLSFGNATNVVQLLAEGAGEFMPLALRTEGISTQPVKELYGELTGNYTRKQMNGFYNFSKSVARTSEAVRRMDLAGQNYEANAEISAQIHKWLKAQYVAINQPMPKHLELAPLATTGTADRYAVARKLYVEAQRLANAHARVPEFKQLQEVLSNSQLADAYELMRNTRTMRLFDSGNPLTEIPYTDTFWNLHESKVFASGSGFNSEIQQIIKDLDQVQLRLAVAKTRNELNSVSVQLQDSVLETFRKAWLRIERKITGNSDTALDIQNNLLRYNDRYAMAELEHLTRLSPQDLQERLWLSFGRITFAVPDNGADDTQALLRAVRKHFLDQQSTLASHHIRVHFDAAAERLWLWLDNDEALVKGFTQQDLDMWRADTFVDRYAKHYVDYVPLRQDTFELAQEVRQSLEEMKQKLADISHNRSQGTLGDMITEESLADIDAAAPAFIRNQFIPVDRFKEALRFETPINFNRTNIGLPGYRRDLMPYVSGNPLKSYTNTAQNMVSLLDARTKAIHLFFDTRHQLTGELYQDFTDAEILQMLRSNSQLRLAALIKDDKFGIVVRDLRPRTVADITLARQKLGASILPVGAFLQAYKKINDFRFGSGFAKFMNRYIIGPTKAGYLSTIGFVMRNILDSFVKNVILTGNPWESGKMLLHTLQTGVHYKHYNDIMKEVLEKNKHHLFSLKTLEELYEANPNRPISIELFQMMHDFIEQGPSAGLSKLQEDMLLEKWKQHQTVRGKAQPKDDLVQKLVNNPWTKFVLSENSMLEQIFRLSGYTWSIMEGRTVDEAMQAVLAHHFDYSVKDRPRMMAEYVIPFVGFTEHNTLFWLDALGRYGWVGALFRDIYTPIWNFDDYSNREMNENQSLQYNILAGNIVFPNNLTMKLSPSIMDAIRLLTDPEEAKSRLSFYIKVPLEIFEAASSDRPVDLSRLLLTNLPMLGPVIQKAWWDPTEKNMGSIQKTYARTGQLFPALLPSIFGGMQRNYYFGYSATGRIYMTHSKEKYDAAIAKGAKPLKDLSVIEAYVRKSYSKKAYMPYPRKYYPKKQKSARKVYARKTYPVRYDPYVASRIIAAARGGTLRLPNPNNGFRNVRPALYRRLYTGTGRSKFAARLVPVTAKNLAAKLRADWRYLR